MIDGEIKSEYVNEIAEENYCNEWLEKRDLAKKISMGMSIAASIVGPAAYFLYTKYIENPTKDPKELLGLLKGGGSNDVYMYVGGFIVMLVIIALLFLMVWFFMYLIIAGPMYYLLNRKMEQKTGKKLNTCNIDFIDPFFKLATTSVASSGANDINATRRQH